MYRAVLFDFDGTIADTLPIAVKAVNDLLRERGQAELRQTEVQKMRALPYKVLLKKMNISWLEAPTLARKVLSRMKSAFETVRPVEGMPKVLKSLRLQNRTVAIVTSNTRENVEVFLSKNSLLVEGIEIVCAMGRFRKDAKIKAFISRSGLSKKEVVYVGDEVRDIEACKAVGIDSIAVTWGYHSEKLLADALPTFIARTPSQLLDYLNQSARPSL